jgi:hypothetical protein
MIIYEEILRAFQKEKVKYILVGGIAVNLLGSLRSTADMDILIEMSDENIKRVVRILKASGYSVKQPVDPLGLADKETREVLIRKKHLKDGLSEVDIIVDTPVDYTDAAKNKLYIKSGDIAIPVISINNLIRMKKNTDRNIDRLDIEELKRIKRLRKRK